MKTKILTTAILVAVFATFSFGQAPALNELNANVDVQLNAKNFIVVRYLNADNDKIKIKVYDANNKFVHQKTVKASGNIKVVYDLAKLPVGDYTFKVLCNKNLLRIESVSKLSAENITIPKTIQKETHQNFYTQN